MADVSVKGICFRHSWGRKLGNTSGESYPNACTLVIRSLYHREIFPQGKLVRITPPAYPQGKLARTTPPACPQGKLARTTQLTYPQGKSAKNNLERVAAGKN